MENMKREDLWAPDLQELAPFVLRGLEANFAHVEVEVADCPDLRALGCAGEGICGSTVLLEVGRRAVRRTTRSTGTSPLTWRRWQAIAARPKRASSAQAWPIRAC